MLINSQVNGSKRTPPNLLLDLVLIDPMYRSTAIVLAVGIFWACLQGLFDMFRARLFTVVVPQRAFVSWCGSLRGGALISHKDWKDSSLIIRTHVWCLTVERYHLSRGGRRILHAEWGSPQDCRVLSCLQDLKSSCDDKDRLVLSLKA